MADEAPDGEDLLLATIGPADPGRTELDRYRDFRAVFFGSEQGRAVLMDILRFGHMGRPDAVTGRFDAHRTMFASGERNLAYRIVATATVEPEAKPAQATTRSPLHRRT